jgi:uncharacterized protein (DUF885 family)
MKPLAQSRLVAVATCSRRMPGRTAGMLQVRGDPGLATRTRYFTGEVQDRPERRLTPQTEAQKRARIQLAKEGLTKLHGFDRTSMNEAQRVSADVMQWQLQTVADEQPFLDDIFPLEQLSGANVNLENALVRLHPLLRERDAENYVAALGQVGTRMEEDTSRPHQRQWSHQNRRNEAI